MATKPFGPFSETFSLPLAPKGIVAVTRDSGGSTSTATTQASRGSHETTVNRSGVRRRKPAVLDATSFAYTRNVFDSQGMLVTTAPAYPLYRIQETGALHASYLTALGAVPTSSTLQSRAEVAALLKLKDQSINLAQAWAERKLTAQLVGDTAFRIAESIMLARRKKWRQAFKALGGSLSPKLAAKSAQQKWLELQYGVLPLLSDVYGSAEALAKRNNSVAQWMVTVRSKRSEETLTTKKVAGGNFGFDETTKTELSYSCSLSYTPGNPLLAALASLGLTNPLALAEELTPYSFVLDWLWPIGDWLACLDASVGWNFHHGSLTRRCVREKVAYGYKYTSFGTVYDASRVTMRQKHHDVNRTTYAFSPIPALPGFKDPGSMVHCANGLALLGQVLGQRR